MAPKRKPKRRAKRAAAVERVKQAFAADPENAERFFASSKNQLREFAKNYQPPTDRGDIAEDDPRWNPLTMGNKQFAGAGGSFKLTGDQVRPGFRERVGQLLMQMPEEATEQDFLRMIAGVYEGRRRPIRRLGLKPNSMVNPRTHHNAHPSVRIDPAELYKNKPQRPPY